MGTSAPRTPLGVGDRAPDFILAGPDGTPTRFYAVAGGQPIALVFDSARASRLGDLVGDRPDVVVMFVTDRAVAQAYGVAGLGSAVVVLDADLRVVAVVTGDDTDDEIVGLLDTHVLRGPQTQVSGQAPVLFVPRVVDPPLAERLIHLAETEAVETGVERSVGVDRREVLDVGYKRRRDYTVADTDLMRELSTVVGRRLMPEIRKAFAFRATRFEGFKIACYDAATGGFFRGHRDNLSASTAHRVFGLTLNLNEDYTGGELRFPEYGNELYRPPAGTALVFSSSHLHEVRDVTAGRRFVLLSFLYGDPPPSG